MVVKIKYRMYLFSKSDQINVEINNDDKIIYDVCISDMGSDIVPIESMVDEKIFIYERGKAVNTNRWIANIKIAE